MGGFSLWHWLVVGVIILLLFGKGRFSEMMGDVAKGIKSFKKGMSEDDDRPTIPPRRLESDRNMDRAPDSTRTPESDLSPDDRREP